MAWYWVFRRGITPITASAAPWRFVTPIPRLFAASSSTVAVKNQKFEKRRQQSLQLVDQYHSSHLIRILDSEINCALHSDLLHCDVDVPEGFPFKVHDIAGGGIILLEREFRGEAIIVRVNMPTPTCAAGVEEGSASDGSVDENDGADGHETDPSIPLVVTVSKGDGSCLQFDARAFPGRIIVNGMAFSNSTGNSEEDRRLAHRGPDFLDLNEKFRKAIHEYLEIRGLTSSTAKYLIEYMISKDTKEYLQWLRNLKKLIEH